MRSRRTLRAKLTLWAATGMTLVIAACGDGPTSPSADDLTLEIVSGEGQSGLPGWVLDQQVIVRVLDREGVPVAGVTVAFQVTNGGGTTTAPVRTTSGTGLASVGWILGQTGTSQTLTVSIQAGSATADFQATRLTSDQADLVVVHGSLASLLGFVLFRDGASLQVLGRQGTQDTLLYLPPSLTAGSEVVVFGRRNRPLRSAPVWTTGVDTIHVTLLPPVVVDLEVHIQAGVAAERMNEMTAQLATVSGIWADEGMGVTLGIVTTVDETDPPRTVAVLSSGLCAGLAVGSAIRIDLVSSIDGGQFTGWGCWAGRIYLGEGLDRFPNLLAHELGHTFTLEHTATGMMFPSPPSTELREGEIFRAHFHQQSVLNTIFDAQPASQRRNCSVIPGPCLPESLDLGSGVVALAADGSMLFENHRFNGRDALVDGVGDAGSPGR